jgi:hypothetical protein
MSELLKEIPYMYLTKTSDISAIKMLIKTIDQTKVAVDKELQEISENFSTKYLLLVYLGKYGENYSSVLTYNQEIDEANAPKAAHMLEFSDFIKACRYEHETQQDY